LLKFYKINVDFTFCLSRIKDLPQYVLIYYIATNGKFLVEL